MQGHTKTHRIDEITIRHNGVSHVYKVPLNRAKKIMTDLTKYEEKDPVPWEEIEKTEINKDGNTAGYYVRSARERAGMTQTELAGKLAIERTNLSNIERGKRTVGKALAQKLGKLLNIDYRVFL